MEASSPSPQHEPRCRPAGPSLVGRHAPDRADAERLSPWLSGRKMRCDPEKALSVWNGSAASRFSTFLRGRERYTLSRRNAEGRAAITFIWRSWALQNRPILKLTDPVRGATHD